MVNKLVDEKAALLDLANRRLEEIDAQKDLTKEQKILAEDLRRVIGDLKAVIQSYKDFAELLMKRPPKKCFISVFNC
jgi:light-regulated signal transduction histidine kinase (bacteriophytochrome)